ncbi:serine/arginine-rich splicing factor 9-like [Discoglossus pictus]
MVFRKKQDEAIKKRFQHQTILLKLPVLQTYDKLPGKGFYLLTREAARAGSGNERIYVGNLPADVREKELEELFHRYGRIRSVELKNRGRCSSSPFAFIKFQDPRNAEDAVFGRNGYDFGSCRLRVEFPRPFRGSRGDGGGYGAPRGRNGPPSRRSDFRVLVSGLPPSGSWQDLKDHMRKAGDVCYADVHKDGMGIVEFIRKEDMEYALRKLDDTKFRSHEGETYYIRVCPERNASYSRSRSRSRGRDSTYQSRRSPSPFRPY